MSRPSLTIDTTCADYYRQLEFSAKTPYEVSRRSPQHPCPSPLTDSDDGEERVNPFWWWPSPERRRRPSPELPAPSPSPEIKLEPLSTPPVPSPETYYGGTPQALSTPSWSPITPPSREMAEQASIPNSAGEAMDDLLRAVGNDAGEDVFATLENDSSEGGPGTPTKRATREGMPKVKANMKSKVIKPVATRSSARISKQLNQAKESTRKVGKTKTVQGRGKRGSGRTARAEIFDSASKASKITRVKKTSLFGERGGKKLRLKNWKGEVINEWNGIVVVYDDEIDDIDAYIRYS